MTGQEQPYLIYTLIDFLASKCTKSLIRIYDIRHELEIKKNESITWAKDDDSYTKNSNKTDFQF